MTRAVAGAAPGRRYQPSCGRCWPPARAIPRQRGRDLGGSLNLNLLVSRGDERLVVRVHRPSVSRARPEAIQHARQQLDAAGVPCSALVVARDGAR